MGNWLRWYGRTFWAAGGSSFKRETWRAKLMILAVNTGLALLIFVVYVAFRLGISHG